MEWSVDAAGGACKFMVENRVETAKNACFSNHWKNRGGFSNHWKNIFQSLENCRFPDELPDCAKSGGVRG
jgi:hypothetical protein